MVIKELGKAFRHGRWGRRLALWEEAVEQEEDGKPGYVLADGRRFKGPSAGGERRHERGGWAMLPRFTHRGCVGRRMRTEAALAQSQHLRRHPALAAVQPNGGR